MERVTEREMEVLNLCASNLVRGELSPHGMKYYAGAGRHRNVTGIVKRLLQRGLIERRKFGGPIEAVTIAKEFQCEVG